MSGEEIPERELLVLFEAARWAPSCFNAQPWRMLYARRGADHWPVFLNLLSPANQVWAQAAAALVVWLSKRTFEHNGKPNTTHSFDAGAAWENLALQGTLRGHVVHGMAGFDYERARVELGVPDDFQVEAMAAIGRPAGTEVLPEDLRKKEEPSSRRPLAGTICEGRFRL